MLNAIKQSFSIVCKHMHIALLFYFMIIVLSLLREGFKSVQVHPIALLIYTIAFILLIIAFVSGWLFTIKKSIELDSDKNLDEEEKVIKSFGLIKQFFPGIGEYFLSTVGFFVFNLIVASILGYLFYKLGVQLFGALDIDFSKISLAEDYQAKIHNYMTSLPQEKLLKLTLWATYGLFGYTLFQLIIMWTLPALFYSSKNPIKAFGAGIKFFFTNIWASVVIHVFLTMLNSIMYTITTILLQNAWLAIIGYILYIYYTAYYVVLIFYYYGNKSKQENKNNFDSGFDIDGEKLAGDKDSTDA